MSKAPLILVVGVGFLVVRAILGAPERLAPPEPAPSEEAARAREAAEAGVSVALEVLRRHGDDLHAGIAAVNGAAGYLEGSEGGGTYRVRARYRTGYSVELSSTGYFGGVFNRYGRYVGGVRYEAGEGVEHRLPTPPLKAERCGRLRVEFLESEAAYCAAVFLQRLPPGTPAAEQPDPEMLFAAGRNRTGASVTAGEPVRPGTQVNLWIGVDKDCSTAPAEGAPPAVEAHAYREGDYDHVHHALIPAGPGSAEMHEGPWSLVEQHPADNQRWRVAWEDQHVRVWDRPEVRTPAHGLQATKRDGYDGDGWPVLDTRGYRALRDYGSRPDFSDQVVEVRLEPSDACEPAAAGDPAD